MKNILMIGTGGTIASEMTPSGLTPELNSTQLLSFVPRIGEMCHVDCVQLYSLDSTNIRPAHWLGVARTVRENYDRYDGFVISHGTDTMAYTAAALSYLIQDETTVRRDLWDKCGEDTLRGLFLQELRRQYDAAPDDAVRRRIEQAARFGTAAMDDREV